MCRIISGGDVYVYAYNEVIKVGTDNVSGIATTPTGR